MAVPDTSPIALFIARQCGVLVLDVTTSGNILIVTVKPGETNRRPIAEVRSALERVYGARYERIQIKY